MPDNAHPTTAFDSATRISIQPEPFELGSIHQRLSALQPHPGAVVTFTGLVRDLDNDKNILALELEHYPGMTEKALANIARRAAQQWPLLGATIVHRIGRLAAGDAIVAIAVASRHRREAFCACEFIMDFLKTDAPFWKKEIRRDGADWVAAKQSDTDAAHRWQDEPNRRR